MKLVLETKCPKFVSLVMQSLKFYVMILQKRKTNRSLFTRKKTEESSSPSLNLQVVHL